MRRTFAGAACALLLAIASPSDGGARDQQLGQTTAAMPSREGVPSQLRGIQRHGEAMGAGVACGLRPPEWASRYREAVMQWVVDKARDYSEAALVMQRVDEWVAYARGRVRANRKEYCPYVANPPDMLLGDRIVA
jgi:hypothetical protein